MQLIDVFNAYSDQIIWFNIWFQW